MASPSVLCFLAGARVFVFDEMRAIDSKNSKLGVGLEKR